MPTRTPPADISPSSSDIADRFSGETDEYPYAEVIGTDLSPIQPGPHPPNCRFDIDDCCSEWVQPPASVGYVHIRGLYGSVADWPTLYAQAYRALRPGGWIEQTEWDMRFRGPDGKPTAHPVLAQWTRDCLEVGERTGKSFDVAPEMAGWIAKAGFTNVTERRFKWPLGPWCVDPKLKEIGRWNLLNWEEGLEGWTLALYTRVLGVSWSCLLFFLFLFFLLLSFFCC